MIAIGRFREETMAFPPGVTVKDYTWGGSKGYLNATPGANPSHFATVIQELRAGTYTLPNIVTYMGLPRDDA